MNHIREDISEKNENATQNEGNRHQKVVTDQLLFHSADSSIFSNLIFHFIIFFIFWQGLEPLSSSTVSTFYEF